MQTVGHLELRVKIPKYNKELLVFKPWIIEIDNCQSLNL